MPKRRPDVCAVSNFKLRLDMQILQEGNRQCPLCTKPLQSTAASDFPKNYSLVQQLTEQLKSARITSSSRRKSKHTRDEYAGSSDFQIFIKTLEGSTLTLDVSPDDTVDTTKSFVFERVGAQPTSHREAPLHLCCSMSKNGTYNPECIAMDSCTNFHHRDIFISCMQVFLQTQCGFCLRASSLRTASRSDLTAYGRITPSILCFAYVVECAADLRGYLCSNELYLRTKSGRDFDEQVCVSVRSWKLYSSWIASSGCRLRGSATGCAGA